MPISASYPQTIPQNYTIPASPRLAITSPAVRHPILKAFAQTKRGKLLVTTPEGHNYLLGGTEPGPHASLKLHNWKALDSMLARGEIGFAEAYIDGQWETSDLPALITFALINAQALEDYFYGRPWYALWVKLRNIFRRNSLSGSRRNILKHYDMGNDFYALWLDKSMTYSCALFEGNTSRSLEDAQQAKYNRILNKLAAKPGEHILEIGCGWGGFAEFAARKGIKVTAVTISDAQKKYAEERIRQAGLDHLVSIRLTDYREVTGEFDYIVSIGMFEHVGDQYWPVYFDTIKSRLRPGGKAMVQSITIDEKVFAETYGKYGFIEEYIFPGGMLPSKPRFKVAAEQAGLTCNEMYAFGGDYALTTRRWLERFESQKEKLKSLGYNEDFLRMWRFYLSSCIAAFTSRRTEVIQAELVRTS